MDREADFPGERWLPVPGFEERYSVSDHGRVWTKICNRALKPGIERGGYGFVRLTRALGDRPVMLKVHRLVLMAFVCEPGPEQIGCHRDGNPANNRLENLYWGTQAENAFDPCGMVTTGTPVRRTANGVTRSTRLILDCGNGPSGRGASAGRATEKTRNSGNFGAEFCEIIL